MDHRARRFTALAVMTWLPAALMTLGCVAQDVANTDATSSGGTTDAAASRSGQSTSSAGLDGGSRVAPPATTAIGTALPTSTGSGTTGSSTTGSGTTNTTVEARDASASPPMNTESSSDAGADIAPEPVTSSAENVDDLGVTATSRDAGEASVPTSVPACTDEICSPELSSDVETVEGEPRSATGPVVTSDAQGNALAAWYQWEEADGLVYSIAASRYTAEAGWTEPTPIAVGNAGSYLTSVCISGNQQGAAIATFIGSAMGVNAAYGVWAARYSPSGGWTAAVAIGSGDSVGASECAIDEAGNALVVWSQYDSEAGETLLQARRSTQDVWEEPHAIGGESKNVGLISLAVDAGGNAVVIWNDYTDDTPHMYSNRYAASGAWSTPTPIPFGAGFDLYYLDIALAADGSGTAVWSEHSEDGLQHQIWASRVDAEGAWSERERLDDGTETAANPLVAVDSTGGAVVVWEAFTALDDGSGRNDVRTNRFTVGAGWDAPLPLASDAGAGTLSLAGNNTGRAVATWRTPYDYTVDGDIAAASFEPSGGWGEVTVLDADPPGDSAGARATVNAAGQTTLVWQQLPATNVTGSDILAAHRRSQ